MSESESDGEDNSMKDGSESNVDCNRSNGMEDMDYCGDVIDHGVQDMDKCDVEDMDFDWGINDNDENYMNIEDGIGANATIGIDVTDVVDVENGNEEWTDNNNEQSNEEQQSDKNEEKNWSKNYKKITVTPFTSPVGPAVVIPNFPIEVFHLFLLQS